MADYLRKQWIAPAVKEDIKAFRLGADSCLRKGHPLQVIEVSTDDEDEINFKRRGILYVTVSDKHSSIRATLTPKEDGEPTRGAIITPKQCSLIFDKKIKGPARLILSIENFTPNASNSEPTYGNPIDILKDATIAEQLDKISSFSDPTRSRPSSPTSPPQSSGPSQIGTQVLATQVTLPTNHSHQTKVGAKARATSAELVNILAQKQSEIFKNPNALKKAPVEEIPNAQIPTVLSQVSDVEVSQRSSKIEAKANSRPSINSDKVASIPADKPPLVNSNSDESEKENSQERLDRAKTSTPSRTTNYSHRMAQPEEKKTFEDTVDRPSTNPFEGMTKIPRKYVQIPKDQLAILEKKDTWYEPSSTSGQLYATIPVKVWEDYLARLSSRSQDQEHIASSDSESSGSESDDESENEHEGDPKSGQKTRSPSVKVEEELTGVLTQERVVSRNSRHPCPKDAEENKIANERVSNSPRQKTLTQSASEIPWTPSPPARQTETLASRARNQKEAIVESIPQGAPVAELPIVLSPAVLKSAPAVDQSTSREATPVPQPDLLQKDVVAGQSTSREATPVPELPKILSPAVTPVVDSSTSRETTPIPQADPLYGETVVGRSTSRETTPRVELPKSPPLAVPQSVRRFPPVNFPSSSGIESELELDELHAEGENVEGEDIKEANKNIAQVPGTFQELPSTAIRGLREVQVEKSPFDSSKSPQMNKLASSSDRRIPATPKLNSSKPEEFKDAISNIPKSSAPKSSSPGLFVTQNEPERNLPGLEDSDSEYASAEDNQISSSPFQNQAIRSSPPVPSPSTPNQSQPPGSVTPQGGTHETPSRKSMQGSPYAQVACTIPNSSEAPKSSQRLTSRSNLQDLNIASPPPSIQQGDLAILDGASDHSPANITPSKRRLTVLAAEIRQEESTRKDTKEIARAGRHEFLLRLQAETPNVIPQTRPQPPDKLSPESKPAPVDEALLEEIVENSRKSSFPAHTQTSAKKESVAAAPEATPKTANETDPSPKPSNLLDRGEDQEETARMEEEEYTVDFPWSPSPPRMSGKLGRDPKKYISPWNDRPPKSFSKSPIESSGSANSGMRQIPRPPAMQNNVLVTPDYHQKFQVAYPEYRGSRKDFTWVLVYVEWLRNTKHSLLKSLIDGFIVMMSLEFMQHVRESRDSGKEVMTGWDFFDQMFEPSPAQNFKKGIITPLNLPSALDSLDQKLVTTFRGQFKKPGALHSQPPEATPTTENKPALPAPKSATKKADDLGATDRSIPTEMATKSKVPCSLPLQKNAAQSATDTPTRKPLARNPSLIKSRQDTPSSLAVKIEKPNTVDSPDLGLDVGVPRKRKFESSGFVHDDDLRGMREMPPAKRLLYREAINEPDVFITSTFEKPQDKHRNSFSARPSTFTTPSLPVPTNPPRSAKSPATMYDGRTPILQRNSSSPHPFTLKTPSLLALAANPPHAVMYDKISAPTVQDSQPKPRNAFSPQPSIFKTPSLSALANSSRLAKLPEAIDNTITTPTVRNSHPKPRKSSSPHPSTFITPSLSVLAKSSRLPKSPHAVMDEKTKVEEWNYEPDDEDEILLFTPSKHHEEVNTLKRKSLLDIIQPSSKRHSKANGKVVSSDEDEELPQPRLLVTLKRKPPPENIQPSAKRQSMADDKVVSISSGEDEELPPSASKSLSFWNEHQRSRQEKVKPSETLQSNASNLLNERESKPPPSPIQPSANRHSMDYPKHDKLVPNETPQPKQNNLKRKSLSESVPRSTKRKSMSFKEFLPNSEFLRKRRESGSLSLNSRNSTPVGQRFETREGKTREPETQGWA